MYYDLLPNTECIGLSTANRAYIYQKFIGGSYIGVYTFKLLYRYSIQKAEERIQKQSLISTIGEWLQKFEITKDDGTKYKLEEYPNIADNKSIYEIIIINRTALSYKSQSGYEDSGIDLQLKYYVERTI